LLGSCENDSRPPDIIMNPFNVNIMQSPQPKPARKVRRNERRYFFHRGQKVILIPLRSSWRESALATLKSEFLCVSTSDESVILFTTYLTIN
jgi:hypothetical protein